MSQQSKIYTGNLSYNTKESDLESHFNKYGNITEVKLITDAATGRSKGFAFITFEDQKDAEEAAAKENGQELDGRKIRVNIATNKPRTGGGGGGRGGRGGSRFGGGWGNRDH